MHIERMNPSMYTDINTQLQHAAITEPHKKKLLVVELQRVYLHARWDRVQALLTRNRTLS